MGYKKFQLNKYFTFCELIDIAALPISEQDMCLYVAYLSKTLKYSSILNYVSAVKFLHMFMGYEYQWNNSFLIKATLTGYKRMLGVDVCRKAPLTFEMCAIINECDSGTESGFIACITVGFFTFLGKANLCPA